jgi:hypothetical protein
MNQSRSPYIIEIDEPGQDGSRIELFVWIGSTMPLDPTYVLSKLIPSSTNTKTFYNISPYVQELYSFGTWKDGTSLAFDVQIAQEYVVNFAVKKYYKVLDVYTLLETERGEFMDGYTDYMRGINTIKRNVLLDRGTYFYNYNVDIPTTDSNGVQGSFDAEMEVGEIMRYTNLVTGQVVDYTNTVAGMRTYGRVNLGLPLWYGQGNKVQKLNALLEVLWEANFKPLCEQKYSPVIIDFINKYGSWSRIFFQKANSRKSSFSSETYKRNPQDLSSFNPEDQGQMVEFNKSGVQNITLNTGWVNDDYAEYLEQLMLSEHVTIMDFDVSESYNPVMLKNKELEKQNGLNNGMINYKLSFDFSYDLINNVI